MKTLYNTIQQCEGILDPDQNKVMNKMTDEMIRSRIREYCTYSSSNACWTASYPRMEVTKVDKDRKGWYVETKSDSMIPLMSTPGVAASFASFCLSHWQKVDLQKGFLIDDIGVYFRWRKHKGSLFIDDNPFLESTDGLPEKLDVLDLRNCCQKSKKIEVHNEINVILIRGENDLKISGNGCKNVLISPVSSINIIAPSKTEVHRPDNWDEYDYLRYKLIKH